jgi:hypothetical protein
VINEVSTMEIRNWFFKGNRKDRKCFTLDGVEIQDPYYVKWETFANLTDLEKAYILGDYFALKEKAKRISEVFKEYVLWDEPI